METKSRQPISAEGRATLMNETKNSMQEVTNLIDKARNSIRFIDAAEALFSQDSKNKGNGLPNEQHHLRRLAEYTIVVGLIQLDITSAIRNYLKGTEPYETLYAAKQLLVTINEGYKQIYNYISIVDGLEVDDQRKKSYWVKDMGRLINQELPELTPVYEEITAKLQAYDDAELKLMTKPRNLAVHYDKVASKVYDMLINLDIETLTKKAIPFMSILNQMVHFSLRVLITYAALIAQRKNEMEAQQLDELEKLKTKHPALSSLMSEIQDDLNFFFKL